MARPASVHGVVVVDKPGAMTSHDVVARLRRVYRQRQVGHAGTLDPDATGVLLVGLGDATRLLRWVSESRKEYRGTVAFGSATDTLDAAGTVVAEAPMPISRADVERAAAGFVGDIEQVPPMVSAIKVAGRPLHELARAGIEIERAPRPVTIHELVVESFDASDPERPRAVVRVVCSSGTYVRTLAADLGAVLGGPAHLATLRRLAVGSFRESEALPLAALEADADLAAAAVLPPAAALRGVPVCAPASEVLDRVRNGAPLTGDELGLPGNEAEPIVAVLDPHGSLVAVYEPWRPGRWKPAVVLATAQRQ